MKASVDKHRRGFAFLIFEDNRYEDAFLPAREAAALFHGDRVQITMSPGGEVLTIKTLERRFKEFVGRYMANPRTAGAPRGGWVVYERKRAREEAYVPAPPSDMLSGEWVRCSLTFHEHGPHSVTGTIVERYGETLPASADLAAIASEFNLTEKHTDAAEEAAIALKLTLDNDDREDLRDVPFITIDGETARDFDDAIYVERDKSGYVLWVAIADVSHYVERGGAIDKSAREKGTSVYFPERAFHMLPRPLSENLCSLRPNEPRLALTAQMHFDYAGRKLSTKLINSVIQSKRRATYTEIEAEWHKNRKNRDWEYRPHFELFKILKDRRKKRGSLDFDLPENEVRVNESGEPISITRRERFDSHRLIEEFMIAANESVTEWIMERNWPFIYRVHEEPAEVSLENFRTLAKTAGVELTLSTENLPQTLSDFLHRIEDSPAAPMLNMALLRSMKQAIYSSIHGGHFGLASEAYTHFTSPIRRYPDLVVHRILKQALAVEHKKAPKPVKGFFEKLDKELKDTCEHCSYRERLAADAEREAIKLKQARIMTGRLGDEFQGVITGMIESGLFVQIPDPYVEGLLSAESMTDDFYEFNEERMIFTGKRRKRTFKIGQEIRVIAVRADIEARQIDFALAEGRD